MSTPAATDGSAATRGLEDPAFRYDRILVAIDDSRESRLALSRIHGEVAEEREQDREAVA